MANFTNWLPHSGRRYEVTRYGEVYAADGKQILPILQDGRLMVDIVWMFGAKTYDVAFLVYITHRVIELPDYLFEEIEMLHCDGCVMNCNVENLTYRFKNGPLEVEDMPGFYYVPFYESYAITRGGELKHVRLKNLLTWYITKPDVKRNSTGGYFTCRISINRGERSVMLYRYRALCLTFKQYGHDIETRVVNHLDGVPSNDHLDNLEWCSYSQNNRHAYISGLRPNSARPVDVCIIATGENIRYATLMDAFRQHGPVIRRLRAYNPNQVATDGIVIATRAQKLANDKRSVPLEIAA